ncbi:MAG TPA: hypothetical protein VKH35_15930 [Thermoanaerobaculia bacterium]|nr:hypothetical protein [Thermoanaerobaculia bacterium]
MESAILASPEHFGERGGGRIRGFLAALYQDVLGRPVDAAAMALFGAQLGTGATLASIALQVLNSPAARQHWIIALIAKYLHHASPRFVLYDGQDQVTASIIGSDEYCRQ